MFCISADGNNAKLITGVQVMIGVFILVAISGIAMIIYLKWRGKLNIYINCPWPFINEIFKTMMDM